MFYGPLLYHRYLLTFRLFPNSSRPTVFSFFFTVFFCPPFNALFRFLVRVTLGFCESFVPRRAFHCRFIFFIAVGFFGFVAFLSFGGLQWASWGRGGLGESAVGMHDFVVEPLHDTTLNVRSCQLCWRCPNVAVMADDDFYTGTHCCMLMPTFCWNVKRHKCELLQNGGLWSMGIFCSLLSFSWSM